ncbi:hypothetical protein EHQ46_14305 [Leptospira yanagawae]|uniref:Lipoprotein n=1 Tax=Leptospira yanagawae TaxID=293069 RepID=A0ABY2LZB7_9LEPT|nr:hypothetical protein [Leptospira yanagawae]TGL18978.1 hypothetical protein EHQ46_14305 [Leptospira yanagawae]
MFILSKYRFIFMFSFISTLVVNCASLSTLSDSEVEERLENCKSLGMPEIPCREVANEFGRRKQAEYKREKEAEALEDQKIQNEKDAKSIEMAKTIKMPPAGMVDPNLSKQMLEAYSAAFSEEKLTSMRAVIVSKSFSPIRHEISGIIIARGFAGVVAMKRPNGECFVASTYYEQVYDGQKYTNVYFKRYSTAWPPESTKYQQLIDCNNVYK